MLASPKRAWLMGSPTKIVLELKNMEIKRPRRSCLTAKILATAVAMPSKMTIDRAGNRKAGNIISRSAAVKRCVMV